MLCLRTVPQSCVEWTSLTVSGPVSELRRPRSNYRRRNHQSQARQPQPELAVLEEDYYLSHHDWPPLLSSPLLWRLHSCSGPPCRPEEPCSPDQSDSLRPPGLTVHSESSTGSSPTCCSTARRRGSRSWWCTRSPQPGGSSPVGGGTVGSSLSLSISLSVKKDNLSINTGSVDLGTKY